LKKFKVCKVQKKPIGKNKKLEGKKPVENEKN
jgi:hypothetical protein